MRRWLPWLVVAAVALLIGGGWLMRARPATQVNSYAACARAGYPITDTDPPSCSNGPHTFLGPRASPQPPLPPVTNVPFDLLVDGDSGGAYPKRQETITSAAAWEQYWRTIHAGLASLPPILPVDFAAGDVVALSEGRQPTTGYNLEVTSINAGTSGTVVGVTESIPTVTCKVADTASNRYFIVRTTRLTPPVSFRITIVYHRCD